MALELRVLRDGEVVLRTVFARGVVNLGRAPANDLVFSDASVSWMHAAVWEEEGAVWVRDLGSANGTFVGGRRLVGAGVIGAGHTVDLAGCTQIEVEVAGGSTRESRTAVFVEDVDSLVRVPLRTDRFHFGGGDADFGIPGLAGRAATLLLDPDGHAWLGTGDEERLLEPESRFEVGGRRFRVMRAPVSRVATTGPGEVSYPYRLRARLDGPGGPEAWVTDLGRGVEHPVEGSTKPVLLYLLGRQTAADRARPPRERGWCANGELRTGIWGRHATENQLDVLVCRLRAELRAAGFDPWFIERRQGQLRARVAEAHVSGR